MYENWTKDMTFIEFLVFFLKISWNKSILGLNNENIVSLCWIIPFEHISVLFSSFEGSWHSSFIFLFVCEIFFLFFYPLTSPSAFTFVCLGRLSSQLDNEECGVTLTSISPCMTFWLPYLTFNLFFDSLINYPVLWFMSKCYVKIIDNRWSSKNFLWHVFFSCLTWWAILSLKLAGTMCVWP